MEQLKAQRQPEQQEGGAEKVLDWDAAVARATSMDLTAVQAYLYKAGGGEEARVEDEFEILNEMNFLHVRFRC